MKFSEPAEKQCLGLAGVNYSKGKEVKTSVLVQSCCASSGIVEIVKTLAVSLHPTQQLPFIRMNGDS